MNENEQRLKEALTPFGWTCTDDFWKRYYSDAWVFNLANAVDKQATTIATIAELHVQRGQACNECSRHWPCRTAEALLT